MTFRTKDLAVASTALAALAVAGCGGGSSSGGSTSTGATGPRATAATQPAVPTSPSNVQGTAPPPGTSTPSSGASPSEPIRVPATFIFTRPGRVEPATVTIPPFVPVQLTLASRDGRPHALALRSGGRTYTLRVAAGGRATMRIPGLRGGRYGLVPVGGGPGATLIVGGQVGP
jgi:hypothetical protein